MWLKCRLAGRTTNEKPQPFPGGVTKEYRQILNAAYGRTRGPAGKKPHPGARLYGDWLYTEYPERLREELTEWL